MRILYLSAAWQRGETLMCAAVDDEGQVLSLWFGDTPDLMRERLHDDHLKAIRRHFHGVEGGAYVVHDCGYQRPPKPVMDAHNDLCGCRRVVCEPGRQVTAGV